MCSGASYPDSRTIADMAHRVGAVRGRATAHRARRICRWTCRTLGADFFAFSGHKLYGPMGIGVLYGRLANCSKKCRRSCTGGEMIESVTRDGAVYAELPHKFEAGTVNAAGAVGLRAAIDYVEPHRL